ncbi:hypothetical protein E2C01_037291 [Portunus trituberculatus]|uniref:Uncharacterized protein n=1 Tax=Portunus trituberculatus TaxID=210409 RepID=A0A5B7FEK6_PORTR|nr:hypothetical protein [Portunus trituberculatus]
MRVTRGILTAGYNYVSQLAAASCARGALPMARSHEKTYIADLKEYAISSTADLPTCAVSFPASSSSLVGLDRIG